MQTCIFKTLFLFFFFPFFPLFSEYSKFETSRKLCILNFKNSSNISRLDYLSRGISSILHSDLKFIYYVYDKNPLIHWRQNFELDLSKIKTVQKKTVSKVQNNPYFIYLNHELYTKNKDFLNFTQMYDLSREKDCFYVLQGYYFLDNQDTLKIEAELFSIKNNTISKFSHETHSIRVYQNLKPLVDKIRETLVQKKEFNLEIDANEKDALVFINDHFVGKTPLSIRLMGGKYKLRIFKQNFVEINSSLKLKEASKLTYNLKTIAKEGFLSVNSNPAYAKVYLGNRYLGQTPFENKKVKVGWNQISFEKEGYKTYYKGIKIEKNKTAQIFASMQKGQNIDYINDRYVFLNYTYSDFSQFSLLSIPFFYVGYLYYNTKAREVRDKLYSRSLIYNLNYRQTSFHLSEQEWRLLYFYEIHQRSKEQKKLDRYLFNSGDFPNRKYGISAYGMGLMSILSFWFYKKSFSSKFSDFAFLADPFTRSSTLNFHFRF